ncbi:MAG TPA: CRISPR-associated protein Cas4, partial [Pyrinomonadaceae bacterium]|nr:CRISPR-associated protein Cas4 [Pyrinomonadaceae bacterium]
MNTALSVHSLHALAYCERLFFLEEVEQVRVADERVYAGRTLHVEIEREETDEIVSYGFESEIYGLIGKVDCIRKRNGEIIPYEHKRGRAARSAEGKPETWTSDRLQIIAYALLVEEQTGKTVSEGRVRYHADNATVRVAIDDAARNFFEKSLARAKHLQTSVERPPVAENERLCVKCSLAPVCLPEEARLAEKLATDGDLPDEKKPLQLFPAIDDRQTLHILTNGAKVGRKGDRLEVWSPDTEEKQVYPVQEIGQVVLHGFSQITTQALRLCADRNLGVHWISYGGRYMGTWTSGQGSVQRRIRQYQALTDAAFCLGLAKRLVE